MSRTPKEHRKDPGYKKAKRQGYRARSAFKLFDIQKRFNIFKRSFYILDIGSTPGSWLQVAQKFAEKNLKKYRDSNYKRDHYKIMGVDLKKVSPLENVKMVQMDVTTPEFQKEIDQYFGDKLDLIMSDASIKKSGNLFSDQVNQFRLCHKILELAAHNLRAKGVLVIKVFQGADYDTFYHTMNKDFSVKSLKPQGSNKKSNEIYLIGFKRN